MSGDGHTPPAPAPSRGFQLTVLIVTHGNLGAELLASAEAIVGALPNFRPLSVAWDGDMDKARDRIRAAVEARPAGSSVVILTDMFGGTPTNLSLAFLRKGEVEILTGVNLPMIVKLSNLHDVTSLAEALAQVARKSQESICLASDVLKR